MLKFATWGVFDRIVNTIFGLLLAMLTARVFGPSILGEYSVAVSISTVLLLISYFGLDPIAIRMIIEKDNPKLISIPFYFRLISGTVILCSCYTLYMYLKSEVFSLICILTLSNVIRTFQVFENLLQAEKRFDLQYKISILTSILGFIIKYVLLLYTKNIIFLIIAHCLESFIHSLFFVAIYKRRIMHLIELNSDVFPLLWEAVRKSFPLFISSLVVIAYTKIDSIMILMLNSEYEAGLYSAGVRISEAPLMIAVVVANLIYPKMIELNKLETNNLKELIGFYYFWSFWLSVACYVIIYNTADFMILGIFGANFNESVAILRIHAISIPFVFIGVIYGRYLLTLNMGWITLQRNTWGLIINVLLNIFLIPAYGGVGAAVATVISQIVTNILIDLISDRTRQHLLDKMAVFNIWRFL